MAGGSAHRGGDGGGEAATALIGFGADRLFVNIMGRVLRWQAEKNPDELRRLTRSLGADHIELRTDRPYLPPLISFFEQRRRRFQR